MPTSATKAAVRALGRLLPAEKALLASALGKGPLVLGPPKGEDDRAVQPGTPSNPPRELRGAFLALVLASDAWPVSSQWAGVRGARILGALDLTGALVERIISLQGCHFDGPVVLIGATTKTVSLSGSYLAEGLIADHATVNGHLNLNHGLVSAGQVNLLAATIRGQVSFRGAAVLVSPGEVAVTLENATVGGGAFIDFDHTPKGRVPFRAHGLVNLSGSSISRDLSLLGAELHNGGMRCIDAEGMKVGGSTSLKSGFTADGEVHLSGASVGSQLSCEGTFETLCIERTEASEVWLIGSTIRGCLNLSYSRCVTLVDDADVWKPPRALFVEHLTYDRIDSPPGFGANERLELMLDPSRTHRFSKQPYEVLAGVYRTSGDSGAARTVLREMHRRAAESDRSLPRQFRRIVGALTGYGYALWRPLVWIAIPLVIVGSLIFSYSSHVDAVVPTERASSSASIDADSCTSAYPCFDPVLYSLDLLLPLDLVGQANGWTPDPSAGSWGVLARWMSVSLTLGGWIVIALAAGGLTERLRDP